MSKRHLKVSVGNKAYFRIKDNSEWDDIRPHMVYEVMDPNSQYPKIYQNCGKLAGDMVWVP
ncbi:hypothetical protein ACPXAZ_26295, partial [Escherichia coli]|uniref:hypothetical protein n=1 Tax=Escherichia coli TaxID=562 RepID=UPI003CE54B2C